MLIGIDPGAHGAIAVFDGAHMAVHDMPVVCVTGKTRVCPAALAAMLSQIRPQEAWCEQVGARPGQGVTSMFAFGRALGIVEGVMATVGARVTMVTPTTWRRGVACPEGKDGARARAMQLFPYLADALRRKKDEGRAEAILIAWHGWQSVGRG